MTFLNTLAKKYSVTGNKIQARSEIISSAIIGKTRSGKNVFNDPKACKSFTMQDHMDAAALHEKINTDLTRIAMKTKDKVLSEKSWEHHEKACSHHSEAGLNDAWDTMPQEFHDEYDAAKKHASKQ